VVEVFDRLIAGGAKGLPITDKRMTRFFLTVQDGIKVVLSSLAMMEGGELFVPKIPSVKVVDLVEAMLPGGDHPVIGIRPGEKLHEVMVSEDDARVTLELPDRYVIEPLFDFWDRTHYVDRGASPVADDFSYASNTNPQWLDVEGIKALIARSKAAKV
jgi:UDP-N-acetylglucosamine 4,6-dehydratase